MTAAALEVCASFLERRSNLSSPLLSMGICICAHMHTRVHMHTRAQSMQPRLTLTGAREGGASGGRQQWEIVSCSPLRLQQRYMEPRVRDRKGSASDVPTRVPWGWVEEYGTALRAARYQELAEISKSGCFYFYFFFFF